MASAAENNEEVSVVLINPDDFSMVNHRYGRSSGDKAIREIADILVKSFRKTDGIFRYSGAVFAVVLPATTLAQCRLACEKVVRHLSGECFIKGNERFTFSVGGVTASDHSLASHAFDSGNFLRRADIALNRAKVMGGATIVCAAADDHTIDDMNINPLSGVFTSDSEKDYRNMALLWESVTAITEHSDPIEMAEIIVDRIGWHIQCDVVALFNVGENRTPTQIASNVRNQEYQQKRTNGEDLDFEPSAINLINVAANSQRVEHHTDDKTSHAVYALPMMARQQSIAVLILENRGHHLELDASDITFLNALIHQFAVAMDRAQLAADWIEQKENESRVLRAELSELRQTVDSNVLLYESEEMKTLLDTAKTVAPSEATVLITGESGTGKELIAHAIHNLSDRADKPFVVFDCGAVATNLIEAELFGHTKGAFTGADRKSPGRIAQADGGTIFLDEIGELPLDLQTKLLRFVQEKTYSPVGSNSDQNVDVRIVAATNRRLQDSVAQGRFRQDLYYRLQVISLQITPLRHRLADILPLAKHFLNRFAIQHGKDLPELGLSAQQKLLQHSWPGNVRELQHLMLRSILTTQGTIEADDLDILPEAITEESGNATDVPMPLVSDDNLPGPPSPPPAPTNLVHEDPWLPFREELIQQINSAMIHNPSRPIPIGTWLTEDLVLAANRYSNQVAKHGAKLVGLPETTYRRHLRKVVSEQKAGLTTRTDAWSTMEHYIQLIIETETDSTEDACLIDRAREELLEKVARMFPGEFTKTASLMGVSPPTYKRWLAEHEG